MKKISIYDYTAYNNRRGANDVVSSYGIDPANHPDELSRQLAFCVSRGGKDALKKVAKAHPDFNLIQSNIEVPQKHEHSNACGCNSFSGVDGQNAKAEVKGRLTDKTELLITGGIVLIGLAMVLKLMK